MSNPDATPAVVGTATIPPYPERPPLVVQGVTDLNNWRYFREEAWKEGFSWLEKNRPETIQGDKPALNS